jgi:ABC-type dipeptide/oligopeptide/nickel transport system permease component
MSRLLARRLAVVPFQALGVVTIVFFLVHLLPGDPAILMAGPQASPAQVAEIRSNLGLDDPLPVQYIRYVSNAVRGDLGTAWHTGNPVTRDIRERGPATLSLITVAMLGVIAVGLVFAGVVAAGARGLGGRVSSLYGFVAGALPDFWIGLALIFLVYYKAGIGAAPSGQFSPGYQIPIVTGISPIDALIAGEPGAFTDALAHLVLPAITLIVVYSGLVVRATSAAADRSLRSDFIEYATAWGIAPRRRVYYALRHVLPVFVLTVGATYGFLLGGAVLVETIFSWGGLGQYAVDALGRADYAAIQGFVIVAGIFTVLVYAATDVLQMILDPRVRR